ncbi:hypothetical protein BBO99_00006038 [Phytophthora kernoviae]|uniref:Protein kinase domain-containing protein n=2 Tax=Phytophthora kernoviae TaxID=325452 RepID=A0A421F9T6_9STRA|nr:hypothetical protein G195_005907 [Phytophthora kernoviae 00238/432]KAG2523911.1 hypothetical protein JM16_005174 [Phytophthora kernoviae]KAG2525728.1 hypothetical protein JM18_004738 [Phytophthora kernoviae]RLN32124.1 hypothetical protein BBI17_006123 [Phytophthora kernoviae]RLN78306.1 hypothetical protein BBO99_00006038 [Phytophthora kernoviae]
MQRLVRREKGASVVQEDEEDDAEDVETEEGLPVELELAEVELQGPPKTEFASLLMSKPTSSLDCGPAKFRSSSRYVNLHSYDPQTQQVTGFTETKIGGHQLDHKRPFFSDWQGFHGPLKTAETAKAEVTIEKGANRWAKRVQGLKTPSKLLKFKFMRTLGVGNFAEVMLVENRTGKLTVLKESDKLPEAANEINILSRVRSPHVVEIIQYFIEEIGHRHFAYIEMEFCDNGDLQQLLEAKGRLKGSAFDSMFHQLCLGLTEIHRHGIVHRDLKPGNVLLTSDGATKIADFGVSTYLESDLLTHHAAGTLAYMAPEVRRYFLGEAVSYDAKADIWSLGALTVAMLTGNPEPRVATRPVEELVEELREEKLDEKYVRLVEGMLATRPEDRLSLEDLLKSLPAMNSRL